MRSREATCDQSGPQNAWKGDARRGLPPSIFLNVGAGAPPAFPALCMCTPFPPLQYSTALHSYCFKKKTLREKMCLLSFPFEEKGKIENMRSELQVFVIKQNIHQGLSSRYSLLLPFSYHVATTCFYFKLPTTGAGVWTTYMYFVPSNSCEWSKNWNLKEMLYNATVSDGWGQSQNVKYLLALMLNWATADTHFVTLYHSAWRGRQNEVTYGTWNICDTHRVFFKKRKLPILPYSGCLNTKLMLVDVHYDCVIRYFNELVLFVNVYGVKTNNIR